MTPGLDSTASRHCGPSSPVNALRALLERAPLGTSVTIGNDTVELDADSIREVLSYLPEAADDTVSTSDAAHILRVSRPSVERLIATGELPASTPGGTHRRLLRSEVLAYKESRDQRRSSALDTMARDSVDRSATDEGYPTTR